MVTTRALCIFKTQSTSMKYIILLLGWAFLCLSCGPTANLNAQNSDGSITLFDNGTVKDGVYIDASGNLGLGQQNLKDKLEVNGQIHAKSVKVDLDNWADHVFDKSYPLDSLSQIEDYIKNHGHLREIPTAEEVRSNGIDLGQINRLLLKKIEELTLHLIDKEKQISQLQLKLTQLEQRLSRLEQVATKN